VNDYRSGEPLRHPKGNLITQTVCLPPFRKVREKDGAALGWMVLTRNPIY